MLTRLLDFTHALRKAGVPVAASENIDALRALGHVPFDDRDAFKAALATTMVKSDTHRPAFETLFELRDAICRPSVLDAAYSMLWSQFDTVLADTLRSLYGLEDPIPTVRIALPTWLGLVIAKGIDPDDYDRPIDFLLPSMLVLAVMSTGLVGLAIRTAYERSYGVLKRLGSTPLTRTNLIIAKINSVILVTVAQIVILIAIATLGFLGVRFRVGR